MVFREGKKVEIPLTKSVGLKWEDSAVIKMALNSNQPFLYVEFTAEDCVYLSWSLGKHLSGGIFLISEVKLFTEDSPTTEVTSLLRKTIKEINGEETSTTSTKSIPIKTITSWD